MSRKRLKSILMYGYAASYATAVILDSKWEELSGKYDYRYLLEQKRIHQMQLDIEKPDISREDEFIYEIVKGGVLTSLYDLSKQLKCGLGINMLSKAYLIVTDNAERTKEELLDKGYSTVLIGALYADVLKVVNDKYEEDGEVSYINRPAKDEIYKIMLQFR